MNIFLMEEEEEEKKKNVPNNTLTRNVGPHTKNKCGAPLLVFLERSHTLNAIWLVVCMMENSL